MVKVKFFFLVTNDNSSLIPRMISKVTQQEENHVGFIFDEDDTWYYGGQSLPNGFDTNPIYKDWLDKKVSNKEAKVLEFNVNKTKQELRELLYTLDSVPYAWLDYIKFITYFITGYKMFPESSERMVCSEACAYIAAFLNIIPKQEDYDYITPGDLYIMLIKSTKVII